MMTDSTQGIIMKWGEMNHNLVSVIGDCAATAQFRWWYNMVNFYMEVIVVCY